MTATDNAASDGHPEPRPGHDDYPNITKEELAARIGGKCTPKTIVRRWKKWGLNPSKIGGELHFCECDIADFFKRCRLRNDNQ